MQKVKMLFCACLILFGNSARADMFGGDVVVLTQILANAVQQLVQLKALLDTGQNSLDLMRDINRGINDSLNIIRTANPNSDPGIYKNWSQISEALRQVETIYGAVSNSKETTVQKDTDQQVAEAIRLNNSLYDYTREIDEIGETIKSQSHNVSPGGAAKLTTQTLGIMLHVQNASLRAQATSLKLQAQSIAIQNRKDKTLAKNTLEMSDFIQSGLSNQKPQFALPRF
jgi:hypothetical protein